MKTIKIKKVISATVLLLAVAALSGCVHHCRCAYAVEGIKTASDFDTKTVPRNKYFISEYVFGGDGIASGDEEWVNNFIRRSPRWSKVFVPKKHWLSFAKQEGVPVKVEVIGPHCSWFSWFGMCYSDSAEVVVTVSGERFGDDPISVFTQYDGCHQCGETEYKPGTPNCKFKPLDANRYWLEFTSYSYYIFNGCDGESSEYDTFFAAVAKKLKELEDEGLIPIQ